MSKGDNDIDRNLAFDSNLQAGRDDDGRISGLEAAENRAHRDGRIHDDDDAEQDESNGKLDAAKARHAERGAQERKLLLGLAKQEPGSAIVDAKGTVMRGVKWDQGQIVDTAAPSPFAMSSVLKKLCRDGLVLRTVLRAEPPAHCEYTLTDLGRDYAAACCVMLDWFDGHQSQIEHARDRHHVEAEAARATEAREAAT